MSTFDGRIREFPNVFVDNFSASFLLPDRHQAFFLSHAHSDHMRGLDSRLFQDRFLTHPRASFYASPETKELLLQRTEYRRIAQAIIPIAVYEPIQLPLSPDVAWNGTKDAGAPEDDRIVHLTSVFLPAQHCPGSISIYFSGRFYPFGQ